MGEHEDQTMALQLEQPHDSPLAASIRNVAHATRLGLVAIVGAAVLAGCGSGAVDSGGFTAGDRNAAQGAMNALQHSSIPHTLVNMTFASRLPPAACQVHLESRNPTTFKVYLFWVPFIGSSYTWLDMSITSVASRDTFHIGSAVAALPGGKLGPSGRSILPKTRDFDTPLSAFGAQQASRNKLALAAHGGDVFTKPGAKCQVLANGYLRLVPNS
jgi:hypothetical protein